VTVALCLYCGEMKYGALFECDKCNHAPTGDEQIDIIFTDCFFDHMIMLLVCGEYIVPQLEPIDRNESCGTAWRNGRSQAEDFPTW